MSYNTEKAIEDIQRAVVESSTPREALDKTKHIADRYYKDTNVDYAIIELVTSGIISQVSSDQVIIEELSDIIKRLLTVLSKNKLLTKEEISSILKEIENRKGEKWQKRKSTTAVFQMKN